MTWLAIIWIVAALLGFAAAAAWEPMLELAIAIASTVDPGLAALVADTASAFGGTGEAVGWLVALAIGVPLTLLWLGLRMVAAALRGPAPRPVEARREREPVRSRAPTRPHGGTYDASPSRAGTSRAEPFRDDEPRAKPRPPAAEPPADAPRWGRQ